MTLGRSAPAPTAMGIISYLTIRIALGHLNSPRSCTISAIQYFPRIRQRRKNEPSIEDEVKDTVLVLQSFCFFLSPRELTPSEQNLCVIDLIYGNKMYRIVDGVLLKFTFIYRDNFFIFRVDRGGILAMISEISSISEV